MDVSQDIIRLSLKLKRDKAIRDLMLLYVAMILNHHRLSQHQHHPQLPLNFIELFQATQQIGAFQVRVKQTLTQVLFTSFHSTQFWEQWGRWMWEELQAWADHIPERCLTPGLLPLQPGDETWTWRETVVIQAMALEAAHHLVEPLPLTSESLEMLLGLQDALVEDSSTIDPKGFEMVPLGLPLLPHDLGTVTVQSSPSDPALQYLPQVQVVLSPQSPQLMSGPQILSHWLWEMTQQFGVEMSYVGLILIAKMGQAEQPWQTVIACDGQSLLPLFDGETHGPDDGLRTLVRRLTLIKQATIRWQEQRLHKAQVHIQDDQLWQIHPIQVCHALSVAGQHGEAHPYYQTMEMRSVRFSVAPGTWCDRLLQLYGTDGHNPLIQFSQMAAQLLRLKPIEHPLAAKVALLLLMKFWHGSSHHGTIGSLLETVESREKIQALASNSMRRDRFFQDWNRMLSLFQRLGWRISENPIPNWQDAPLSDLDWLHHPIAIQIQPQTLPIHTMMAQPARSNPQRDKDQATPILRRRMEQISSQALERALASRGMSQAKLARSLNLDRSTINRWINGSRPIHPRYRPLIWELLGPELQEP